MEPDEHPPETAPVSIDPLLWMILRDASYGELLTSRFRECAVFPRHRLFSSCDEAIGALRAGGRPNVILVDISDACAKKFEAIGGMRSLFPAAQVLVLAQGDDEETVLKAICAGATGYLLKENPPERVIEAVKEIALGGSPMEPKVAHRVLSILSHVVHQKHEYHLTDREKDILRLIAEGKAKKEIADTLTISFFTVDTHIKNIYEKLHVHSQGAAVSKAYKENLLF